MKFAGSAAPRPAGSRGSAALQALGRSASPLRPLNTEKAAERRPCLQRANPQPPKAANLRTTASPCYRCRMSTVRVALTQMACSDDADSNLATAAALVERRPRQARRSSARRSCFARSTSARSRITASFSWRSRYRDRRPRRSRRSRRHTASSSWRRCSSGAPPGCITTRRSSSTPMDRCWASTARCTSRTTRSTTRSSTSRPATPAFARGRRATRRSACWCAGISGFPRARG